jgi:tetratricopeptide (TPR) repeat protein
MVAVKQGNMSLTEFLVKSGASPRPKNLKGETALMQASDIRLAQTLISAGSNLLEKNNNGESALQIATRNGHADIARFFRELEQQLRREIETELVQGDRAAETNKLDDALSHYANAISKAIEIGGSTERDVLVRVIKTVNGWPNPPALSDKGREHLVRSSYILKKGQDLQQAEKEIVEVLRADPWWLEGYYNLGILQSNMAKFDDAEQNLALFIAASPDSPKARAAQDKIYELRIAKEEAEKISGVKGKWVDDHGAHYDVGIDGNTLRIVS